MIPYAKETVTVEIDGSPSRTLVDRITAAAFYAIASLQIVFVNKFILTNYHFESVLTLALSQSLASAIILYILSLFSLVNLHLPSVRDVLPLVLIYSANVVTGLSSTQSLSLPMFVVLRRLAIPMTMVLEYFILHVSVSKTVQCSVILLVIGSAVAALDDLSFDLYGYVIVTVNNLFTALNNVVMKKRIKSAEMDKSALLFYNALLGSPIIAAVAFTTGDFFKACNYVHWNNPVFIGLFASSSICGLLLNYSTMLCTLYNSALTTSCVGSMRNILVTYTGMIFSPDYKYSVNNFIGINISVVASIMYTYATLNNK